MTALASTVVPSGNSAIWCCLSVDLKASTSLLHTAAVTHTCMRKRGLQLACSDGQSSAGTRGHVMPALGNQEASTCGVWYSAVSQLACQPASQQRCRQPPSVADTPSPQPCLLSLAQDPLQVDLFKEGEDGELGAALVLVQLGQHAAALRPCCCQNGAGDGVVQGICAAGAAICGGRSTPCKTQPGQHAASR